MNIVVDLRIARELHTRATAGSQLLEPYAAAANGSFQQRPCRKSPQVLPGCGTTL